MMPIDLSLRPAWYIEVLLAPFHVLRDPLVKHAMTWRDLNVGYSLALTLRILKRESSGAALGLEEGLSSSAQVFC